MPWNRNDPDPLEARRRQLAEQERLLSQQRKLLTEQLRQSGDPSSTHAKPAEPPIWRMEDDGPRQRVTDPTPRNLARQRRRDRLLVFALIVLLLIVMGIVLWVAHVHNITPASGA
jgi:hypothetical protein